MQYHITFIASYLSRPVSSPKVRLDTTSSCESGGSGTGAGAGTGSNFLKAEWGRERERSRDRDRDSEIEREMIRDRHKDRDMGFSPMTSRSARTALYDFIS
jgi:hypothetical protein